MKITSQIINHIPKFFANFDLYQNHPQLNHTKSTYQTKFASILSFSFILIILILYINSIQNYSQNHYIQYSDQTITTNFSSTKKSYITNKNFFSFISIRNRITGIQIDPSNDITTYMLAQLHSIKSKSKTIASFNLQQKNCTTYIKNFQNAPNVNYCLGLPDKIQISLNEDPSQKQIFSYVFIPSCNNYVLCTGPYYDAMINNFDNFWSQNTYIVYFTTRYLNNNNQVVYKWNQISSNQYVQGPNLVNYISIGLSNVTYYIDDSILPWRYNKTYILQSYYSQNMNDPNKLYSQSDNGLQIKFYTTQKLYFIRKNYLKLDELLGMLGGGIFLLYLIFRCVGKSYNQFWSRIELTNRLYIIKSNEGILKRIDVCSRKDGRLYKLLQYFGIYYLGKILGFIIFRQLRLKKYEFIRKSDFFKDLLQFENIYQECINDRQIITIYKKLQKIIRILDKKLPSRFTTFKKQGVRTEQKSIQKKQEQVQVRKADNLIERNQQEEYLNECLQKLQITEQEFNLLLNVNQKKNLIKNYYSENLTYQQLIQNKKLQKSSQLSKTFQKIQSYTIINILQTFFKYIDIFKVYPNFTADSTPLFATAISGIFSISAILLSILTFIMPFIYFLQTNHYHISSQTYDVPYSNININVLTNQNFKFALCFMDNNGLVANIDNLFKTQSKIQLYQYNRIGNIISNSSYTLTSINNLLYFDSFASYLTSDYSNCYKIPDSIPLTIKGSPLDNIQSYFSIRIQQYCYSKNSSQCILANRINKQATLNILNNYQLKYLMSQASYISTKDSVQYNLVPGTLFLQRGNANSSIKQQILVDQLRIIDDKTMFRQNTSVRLSEITTKKYYNNYADIQILDNKNLSYEVFFRPSGRRNQYILTSPKTDIMFGMIGGIFFIIITFFSIFALPYNRFSFKLIVGQRLYKIYNYTINCLNIFLFVGMYPIRRYMKSIIFLKKLYPIKRLDSKINKLIDIQNLLKKMQILINFLKGLQNDQIKKQLYDIYIKQTLKNNQSNDDRDLRVANQFQEQNKINKQQKKQQEIKQKEPEYQLKQKQLKSQQQIQVDQQYQINNELDKQKQIVNFLKEENIIKYNKNAKNMQQSKQYQKLVLNDTNIIKQQIFKQSSQIKNIRNQQINKQKLTHHINKMPNFLSAFDIFGIHGQLYFQSTPKYGTCIGGLCSIISIILIILWVFNYTILYLNSQNYQINKNIKQINSINSSLKFVTNNNFKFAIGFIDKTNANIKNIQINTTGIFPLLTVAVVQSTIKRNINSTIYSEIIYPMTLCPLNYLNDSKFRYVNYTLINIQNCYCLPNNIQLQTSGNINSEVQKWFVISIAVNCHNFTDCTSRLSDGKSFFTNYNIKYYISSPIINSQPQTYKFIEQPFVYVFRTASQVNNITINPSIYITDNFVYPWNNNQPNLTTYQYIYNGALENFQSYQIINNRFSKNLTFSNSYVQSIYTKKIIGIDKYIGMIGGITAFIIFLIGIFVWKFNEFSMYYEIGKRLYLTESDQVQDNMQQIIPKVNQLMLYIYMILYYSRIYKIFERKLSKYKMVIKVINKVQTQMNYIRIMKQLLRAQSSCNRLLYGKQKQYLKIYLKKISQSQKQQLKMKISQRSIQQLRKLQQKYEISDYQIMNIQRARRKKIDLRKVMGKQFDIFNKYMKIEQNLERIRSIDNQIMNQNVRIKASHIRRGDKSGIYNRVGQSSNQKQLIELENKQGSSIIILNDKD